MQRLWVCLVVCVLSPGSGVRAEDEAAVVRPADNGAALVNPGTGWVFHYYDNVPAHYGSKLAPSDTLVQHAAERGLTLRDDSILVQAGKRAYFHAG